MGTISFSGELPDPGIDPKLLYFLHWQGDSLPLVPPMKPDGGGGDDANGLYLLSLLPFYYYCYADLFNFKFSLEYSCFTMLCEFLL